jgi:hypothetical protein
MGTIHRTGHIVTTYYMADGTNLAPRVWKNNPFLLKSVIIGNTVHNPTIHPPRLTSPL